MTSLLIFKRTLFFLSVSTLILQGPEPVWAQLPTMPGGYSLPEYLEPITLKPVFRPEPLLQAARKVIGEVALVVPGDNVLILSDSSINPLLPQVFEQAALEKKAGGPDPFYPSFAHFRHGHTLTGPALEKLGGRKRPGMKSAQLMWSWLSPISILNF